MEKLVLRHNNFIKHPKEEGVFMKHFFSSDDNDRLNNVEIKIEPGYQISYHVHEQASEFFYVVSGQGEFFVNREWVSIQKGDAMKAPIGEEHAVRNNSREILVLFSTFSPPIR